MKKVCKEEFFKEYPLINGKFDYSDVKVMHSSYKGIPHIWLTGYQKGIKTDFINPKENDFRKLIKRKNQTNSKSKLASLVKSLNKNEVEKLDNIIEYIKSQFGDSPQQHDGGDAHNHESAQNYSISDGLNE